MTSVVFGRDEIGTLSVSCEVVVGIRRVWDLLNHSLAVEFSLLSK